MTAKKPNQQNVSDTHMITLWRGHLKGTHTLPLVYGRYTPHRIDFLSVHGGGNNPSSGQYHANPPSSRRLDVDVGVVGGVALAERGIHWTLNNVTGRVTERRKVVYYVHGEKRERYITDAIWVEGGHSTPAVAIRWDNTDVSIPAGHRVVIPINFSGYPAGFDLSLHPGSYVSDPSKVSFDRHNMILRGPLGTDGRNAFQINVTPKADSNSVDETVTVALGKPIPSGPNCLLRDGTTRSDVICADQAIPISADTTVSEKQAYVRDAQKTETYEVSFAQDPTFVNEQNGPSEPVLKLSKPARTPISIPVTLVSGTALHEKDFKPAPNEEQEQGIQFSGLSGNFYFLKGDQTATIEIQINDDDVWEQEEEFYIDLDTANFPTGVSLKSGTKARGTVRIRDNDKHPGETYVELEPSRLQHVDENQTSALNIKLVPKSTGADGLKTLTLRHRHPTLFEGEGKTAVLGDDFELRYPDGTVVPKHDTQNWSVVDLEKAKTSSGWQLSLAALNDGVYNELTRYIEFDPIFVLDAQNVNRGKYGLPFDLRGSASFAIYDQKFADLSFTLEGETSAVRNTDGKVCVNIKASRILKNQVSLRTQHTHLDTDGSTVLHTDFSDDVVSIDKDTTQICGVSLTVGQKMKFDLIGLSSLSYNNFAGESPPTVTPRTIVVTAVADANDTKAIKLQLSNVVVPEGETRAMHVSAIGAGPDDCFVGTIDIEDGTARKYYDYFARGRSFAFCGPGGASDTIRGNKTYIQAFRDRHDDGGETAQATPVLRVAYKKGRSARITDQVGISDTGGLITITNDGLMPAAWLARFGRTVAEQALDGIAGRVGSDRAPGVHGAIAGQALSFDAGSGSPGSQSGTGSAAGGSGPLALAGLARGFGAHDDRFGAGSHGAGSGPEPVPGLFRGQAFGNGHSLGESRTMTAREALLGSSFSLTGQQDGSGGSLAFWGRAAQSGFEGVERGDGTDMRLDGTVTTGMLGADYARGNWLVGLALTQSSSEGNYADTGGDGDVEASLTAAVPYAALQASERLKLWGAAGYGTGEVTLKPQVGGNYRADIDWTMAAAGLRGDVIAPPKEGSGPALAVTSDALWARTTSDKTRGDLAASESDVTRLRLGLEGSYRVALEEGGSITPKLEVGARHDGGDAETGFGVELGGGIAWVDPKLGLSLDLSGRTLIAHEEDDLKDRGFAASLAWDPAPATKRGPSLTLTQDWGGRAEGGLDALFAPDPLEDRTGSGEATSRWAMEAAYGLPVLGGRFTGSPHVGFGLATAARDYTIGWRLTPEAATAPDVSFGLKAVRRESDTARAEHSVGVEVRARW